MKRLAEQANKVFFRALIFFGLILPFGLTLSWAAEQPVVTWVYMTDAEPTNWEENGVAKGVEVEIAKYVLGRLGIKVVHKFYPWARAQLMVEEGKADCMMTTPTVKRFKYAIFGKEHTLPRYWNLFVRKGNTKVIEAIPGLTKLEDLRAYELVDFRGNGWTAAFMKEGYNIHQITRLEQISLLLAKGRFDLAINSSDTMNWWAEKQGVKDQLEEYDVVWSWTRFHFVFMVSRQSSWVGKGLVRAMDEELKKMKESGAWKEVLKKYRNPHGFGKPFTSHLDEAYEREKGFYQNYDNYPVYRP